MVAVVPSGDPSNTTRREFPFSSDVAEAITSTSDSVIVGCDYHQKLCYW